MIVDRDRQRSFCQVLSYDILAEELEDLAGPGDRLQDRSRFPSPALCFLHRIVAKLDARGADIDIVGPLDHRAGVAGALATEIANAAPTSASAVGWSLGVHSTIPGFTAALFTPESILSAC